MKLGNATFAQGQDIGALTTLYVAVASDVNGCDYIGPNGGMRCYPVKVMSNNKSYDKALAKAPLESV
jgi:hypothetical protein